MSSTYLPADVRTRIIDLMKGHWACWTVSLIIVPTQAISF